MVFADHDKPGISENWRLRNDGNSMVAYYHSLQRLVSRSLTPFESLFVLLFDGNNSWKNIKQVARGLMGEEGDASDGNLEKLAGVLAELPDFFTLDGKITQSLQRPLADLLPDLANFHYDPYRLQRPISIAIAYSNRCQCDCVYCYAEREPSDERSLDDWLPILDELAANDITLVDIGGADIFCRRDALEIMEALAARKFSFFVSTKALVTKERARRMAALDIGNKSVPHWALRPIQISLDSVDEKLAAVLARQKNYLNHARTSIENLLEAGARPRMKAVLTSYNAEAPLEIVRSFAPLGVDEFHFVQYSRGLYRHSDDMFLSLEQKLRLAEIEDRIRQEFPDIEITMQKDTSTGGPRNLPKVRWDTRPNCSGGRSKMLVKPNGDVTLCEQTPAHDPFIVGNVFRQGVLGVWNSEEIHRFNHPSRTLFEGTVCHGCGDFHECHHQKGWCFRDALACYGTMYDAPPDCPHQHKPPPRAI